MRGESAMLAGAASLNPYRASLGQFSDNVAHSNTQAGLQMYLHGYMPPENTTFSRLRAYKNNQVGGPLLADAVLRAVLGFVMG